MKNTLKKFFITSLIVCSFILIPTISFAQGSSGFVQCGKSESIKEADGSTRSSEVTDECDFGDFMSLINRVITFLIFDMALPLCAIVFAYSGWLFMTSGENPGNRSKAKKMMINVVVGLALAMASWLIVTTILQALGADKVGSLFLGLK